MDGMTPSEQKVRVVKVIRRLRDWWDKCREGEGFLVYWCTRHGCEWQYDKYARCEKRR